MNKRILLFLFFFGFVGFGFAQTEAPVNEETTEDIDVVTSIEPALKTYDRQNTRDTNFYLRYESNISRDSVRAWKNSKDYLFLQKLDSLLDDYQKKNLQKDTPGNRNSNSPGLLARLLSSGIMQLLLWGLGIFFVGFIIYKLFLSNGMFSRTTKGKTVTIEAEDDEALMHKDYDMLIHQACKLGDYRVAVRYLFLKTLQRLDSRSLISFSIDKTNSTYVYELADKHRLEFSRIVLNYEYIWYGNIAIDKSIFDQVEAGNIAFLNKI